MIFWLSIKNPYLTRMGPGSQSVKRLNVAAGYSHKATKRLVVTRPVLGSPEFRPLQPRALKRAR